MGEDDISVTSDSESEASFCSSIGSEEDFCEGMEKVQRLKSVKMKVKPKKLNCDISSEDQKHTKEEEKISIEEEARVKNYSQSSKSKLMDIVLSSMKDQEGQLRKKRLQKSTQKKTDAKAKLKSAIGSSDNEVDSRKNTFVNREAENDTNRARLKSKDAFHIRANGALARKGVEPKIVPRFKLPSKPTSSSDVIPRFKLPAQK